MKEGLINLGLGLALGLTFAYVSNLFLTVSRNLRKSSATKAQKLLVLGLHHYLFFLGALIPISIFYWYDQKLLAEAFRAGFNQMFLLTGIWLAIAIVIVYLRRPSKNSIS